jgi:hypothetical protein
MLAEFVRGLMIRFVVRGRSFNMGVRGQIVQFCGSIMRALGHDVLLNRFDANQPNKAISAFFSGQHPAKWAPSSALFRAQDGAQFVTRYRLGCRLRP